MEIIRISLTRRSEIIEECKADIEVNDPTDADEIENAISRSKFKRFLVNDRKYLDPEWEWKVETNNAAA